MIGLHLTIDGWKKNRDRDGWRLLPKASSAKAPQPEFVPGDDSKMAHEWDSVKDWVNEDDDGPKRANSDDPEESPNL